MLTNQKGVGCTDRTVFHIVNIINNLREILNLQSRVVSIEN